jgi:hypothetical protein
LQDKLQEVPKFDPPRKVFWVEGRQGLCTTSKRGFTIFEDQVK